MPAIQLWSGGKDSAMALWVARQAGELDVQALASTVAPRAGRTTWHGVRIEVMRRQAAAIGLPFIPIPVPSFDEPEGLIDAIATFLQSPQAAPYPTVVWGDLNAEAGLLMHQEATKAGGKRGAWPLWDIRLDTSAFAHRIIEAGFKAIVTSVDTRVMDGAFVGRNYDEALLADLPVGVDHCAESGEFHTFVWDGPIFREPVRLRRSRFATFWPDIYCDMESID